MKTTNAFKLMFVLVVLVLLSACGQSEVETDLEKNATFIPKLSFRLQGQLTKDANKMLEAYGFTIEEIDNGVYSAIIPLDEKDSNSPDKYMVLTSSERLRVNQVESREVLTSRSDVNTLNEIWEGVAEEKIEYDLWVGQIQIENKYYLFADGPIINEYEEALQQEAVQTFFDSQQLKTMASLITNSKSAFRQLKKETNFTVDRRGFAQTYAKIKDRKNQDYPGTYATIYYGYLFDGAINVGDEDEYEWVNYDYLNFGVTSELPYSLISLYVEQLLYYLEMMTDIINVM